MVAGRKASWKLLFESNIAGSSQLFPHNEINIESCLLPENRKKKCFIHEKHLTRPYFRAKNRFLNRASSALELISTWINTTGHRAVPSN